MRAARWLQVVDDFDEPGALFGSDVVREVDRDVDRPRLAGALHIFEAVGAVALLAEARGLLDGLGVVVDESSVARCLCLLGDLLFYHLINRRAGLIKSDCQKSSLAELESGGVIG